jgi:hypothetical protein
MIIDYLENLAATVGFCNLESLKTTYHLDNNKTDAVEYTT